MLALGHIDDEREVARAQQGEIRQQPRHAPVAVPKRVDVYEAQVQMGIGIDGIALAQDLPAQPTQLAEPGIHERRYIIRMRILDEGLHPIAGDRIGAVGLQLPGPVRPVDIGDHGGLYRPVQVKQALDRNIAIQPTVDEMDGLGMANYLLMVLQGFAGDRQSLFDDEFGLAEGEGIALDSGGTVGLEIADLAQQSCADVRVQSDEGLEVIDVHWLCLVRGQPDR